MAVDSYIELGSTMVDDREIIIDIEEHLHLAADIGARFLRLFPGGPAARIAGHRDEFAARSCCDSRIVDRLLAIIDIAHDLKVTPVVETHDSHARGEDLSRILDALGRQAPGHCVGAIWDVAHPFRMGEAPQRTWRFLAPHLLSGRGFVQFKDMVSRSDMTPALIGTGVVPLREIVDVLGTGGYRGPLSLEWERTWYPQIAPLPAALQSMTAWLATARGAVVRDPRSKPYSTDLCGGH